MTKEEENKRRAERICGLFIDLKQYEYPEDWINPVLSILNECGGNDD